MSEAPKRKWLPSEANRLLVLAALVHAGAPCSKAQLAREVRANHYVITKVLDELQAAAHIEIQPAPEGYAIGLTDDGFAFHSTHGGSLRALYGEQLSAHFRYGRRPGWARF